MMPCICSHINPHQASFSTFLTHLLINTRIKLLAIFSFITKEKLRKTDQIIENNNMVFERYDIVMEDLDEEQTPPVSLEPSTLVDSLKNLAVADPPVKSLVNNTEISTIDVTKPTYVGALRLMIQLFNAGKSPEELQALFASWNKFFPLIFVQLLVGGDGGLTSIPGFDFSAVAISPILNSGTSPPSRLPRMAPRPPINPTPAVRALERAERYPLHINARTIALTVILRALDDFLDYDQMLTVLIPHGFRISERFYWYISFSRMRWGTPLECQEYSYNEEFFLGLDLVKAKAGKSKHP